MMTRKERNSRNKEGLLKLSPVVMETSRPFSLLSAWQWTVESETDLSNCLQGGSIIIQWAHASLSCFPSLSLTPFVCLSLCLWSFWHFFWSHSLFLPLSASLTLALVSLLLIHLHFYVSFCASLILEPNVSFLYSKSPCHGGGLQMSQFVKDI